MSSRCLVLLLCGVGLSAEPVSETVKTYCSGCHNGVMRSPSGVLLDVFDASKIAENPEVWSRAYRQLQAGTMPPVGAPRPDRKTYVSVIASVEQALCAGAKTPANSNDEIARRLATLLWNSAPDAALLQDRNLNDRAALERQVRRMLGDDRAKAFVSGFFFKWLQLDSLATADPDKRAFPDYEPSLRDAFERETELFLLSQLREDRDPVELWSASYTFINEQLAKHYGFANVRGAQFRRYELPSPERAGLLGQGSVLMATSRHQHGPDGAYTTPATRAKWVRMHYFGVPPPNPFPGAQPVKPGLPITPQVRVLPSNPCTTCHQNFFPLGYALENFDPIGRWRTRDQAGPVDASGAMVDGSKFDGVVELRKALLERPEAFHTNITERLIAYVNDGSTAPAKETPETLIRARQILHDMDKPRWSALIAAVLQ